MQTPSVFNIHPLKSYAALHQFWPFSPAKAFNIRQIDLSNLAPNKVIFIFDSLVRNILSFKRADAKIKGSSLDGTLDFLMVFNRFEWDYGPDTNLYYIQIERWGGRRENTKV